MFFASTVNTITRSVIPAPLYGPPTDLLSAGDVGFAGNVSGGAQYVTDLSTPIDPATYLGFPDRVFDVFIEFGDGDYGDQIGPYQLVTTIVQYQVNSLTVTPIPEPGLVSLLVPAISLVALCRRRVR